MLLWPNLAVLANLAFLAALVVLASLMALAFLIWLRWLFWLLEHLEICFLFCRDDFPATKASLDRNFSMQG